MRIIYRMRGLLGDATEEFIENLNNSTGMLLRKSLQMLTFIALAGIFHSLYLSC